MTQVKVYTTPTCPWCKKTKQFLDDKGVDYEELDVSKDHDAAHEMIDKSGQRGVPVTLIEKDGGEKVIIGYDKDQLEMALNG